MHDKNYFVMIYEFFKCVAVGLSKQDVLERKISPKYLVHFRPLAEMHVIRTCTWRLRYTALSLAFQLDCNY